MADHKEIFKLALEQYAAQHDMDRPQKGDRFGFFEGLKKAHPDMLKILETRTARDWYSQLVDKAVEATGRTTVGSRMVAEKRRMQKRQSEYYMKGKRSSQINDFDSFNVGGRSEEEPEEEEITETELSKLAEVVLETLKKIGAAGYGTEVEGGAQAVLKCTRIADFAELLPLLQKVVDAADGVKLDHKFDPYQASEGTDLLGQLDAAADHLGREKTQFDAYALSLNKIEVAAGQLKSQAAAASDELHDTQRHLKRLKTPSTGPAAALVASVALNIAGKVVGMNAGEDAVAAVSRFKDTQDDIEVRASQKESDAERVTQRLEAINAVCVVLNKFLSTEMARAREEFERTQTISQEKYEELERAVVERMEATKHVARSAYKEEDHQPKPPKPWSIFG